MGDDFSPKQQTTRQSFEVIVGEVFEENSLTRCGTEIKTSENKNESYTQNSQGLWACGDRYLRSNIIRNSI